MNRRSNIIMVWVVLGLIVLAALFFGSRDEPPAMAYSDFKSLIRERAVASAVVSGSEIEATLVPDWRTRLTGKAVLKKMPPGASKIVTTLLPVEDRYLVRDLEGAGVELKGEPSDLWVSVLLTWIVPLLLVMAFWIFMIRRQARSQGSVVSFGKSRVRVYRHDDVKGSFEDVAGVDEAREELLEVVEYLRQPEKFIRVGAKIPKGVLLVGPPGTGKTLLARAVAGEANVAFFSISGSEFVEMFVGVGASRVRDLFEQAIKASPCIIFVDELDALGKVRGVSMAGGNDEREQTLNQLLVEMDGFETTRGVVIMAATNRPEILDPALLRPGRFDRQILVDKPDRKGREAILGVHAKNVALGPGVDLERVAGSTPGLAGADLANIVNEAALLAARHGRDSVTQPDFDEAIERVVAGLEKRGRLITDKERRIIAVHEVGHAVVAESIPDQDPVRKISIVPRGLAALGYTFQAPTEDRYLLTRTELNGRLSVLLGGRAAEVLVLGEMSTGAHNDLARASDIARSMVTQFGMSQHIGPVSLDPRSQGAASSQDPFMAPEYGNQVADRIDVEVKRLVEEAESRAVSILTGRQRELEEAADRLIEREYLDGDGLRELLEAKTPAPEGELSDGETDR